MFWKDVFEKRIKVNISLHLEQLQYYPSTVVPYNNPITLLVYNFRLKKFDLCKETQNECAYTLVSLYLGGALANRRAYIRGEF